MNREQLEAKANELKVKYTQETSDDNLLLLIELAEKSAQLEDSETLAKELAEKLAKLEIAAESGTNLTVIKHGKDMYTTHAKQFLYNPSKRNAVKRGSGGLVSRGLEKQKGARIIAMKDIENEENADALKWLVETESNLLQIVTKGE